MDELTAVEPAVVWPTAQELAARANARRVGIEWVLFMIAFLRTTRWVMVQQKRWRITAEQWQKASLYKSS
jgi:hypothetical protein